MSSSDPTNHDSLVLRVAELEHLSAAARTFADIVLAGGGLQEILDALAKVVSKSVIFDDTAHQLVAYACSPNMTETEMLERWSRHTREPHGAKGADSCTWTTVQLRDEEWGRLHIFTDGGHEYELDRSAAEHAAVTISLWLLTRRESSTLIDRARSELIADLWQGRRWSHTDVLARSRSVGGDLTKPILAGIAIRFGEKAPSGPSQQRLITFALSQLQHTSKRLKISCLAAVVESTCLGIIGLSAEQSADGLIDQVSHSLLATLSAELSNHVISIGVSRSSTTKRLKMLLTEATDSASHGALTVQKSGCYRSTDLGLRSLLTHLANGPDLSQYVEDELGPLLSHDSGTRAPLLPTLREYLEFGGNKSLAAKKLHVERRSLYYRLERIENILDVPLDDASVRLRLQVAVQGLDVLQGSGNRMTPRPLPTLPLPALGWLSPH